MSHASTTTSAPFSPSPDPTSPLRAATAPVEVSHSSPRTIVCRNPATGELLGEVPAMDTAEVQARLGRARVAQAAWAQTSFAERREVLRCLLELILDRKDELCRMISAEAGKTLQN